ncbi:DUF2269 family protein [Streptomyces yerevanensis]|uniref:DUF2269 family protein n=1 Tax=Streptomyces yerevanensis TaxID=66378 RepID=UPI000527B10F|nr:DUF2269 family protein [Streptomyces yerevanensis]
MTKFLLTVHVIAAIVAIGPVTVAASMFPPAARRALAEPGDPRALETVRLLHRICRVYATVGVVVPVFGFATAGSMGVLGDAWLIVSIALTTLAAAALIALVLPRQEALLEAAETGETAGAGTDKSTETAGGHKNTGKNADDNTGKSTETVAATKTAPDTRATAQLAMYTGIFNLLWATVTILMIVRPGSTTGA